MPEIRYIPAVGAPENAKLPVAAYCRVSSDSDDQLNSLSAQVREYTKQITADPDWELAGIYADAAVIIGLKIIRLKKFQKHGAF